MSEKPKDAPEQPALTEPSFSDKAAAYHDAIYRNEIPPWVPSRIRLLKSVHGDWPFNGTVAPAGDRDCFSNKWGVIYVAAANDKKLGIKPGEYIPIEFKRNEHAPAEQPAALNPPTEAQRLLAQEPGWRCRKCGKLWLIQGLHPDCDGEASDMERAESAPKRDPRVLYASAYDDGEGGVYFGAGHPTPEIAKLSCTDDSLAIFECREIID